MTAEAKEWMYEIIRTPRVTEKTAAGSVHKNAQVTFVVRLDATKARIKDAVEALWSVKVKAVNTLIQKGKTKRFRGIKGKQNTFKKAIVTLAEGHTIDTESGV